MQDTAFEDDLHRISTSQRGALAIEKAGRSIGCEDAESATPECDVGRGGWAVVLDCAGYVAMQHAFG